MESPSVTLMLAIALAKPFTLSSSNADFKLYRDSGDNADYSDNDMRVLAIIYRGEDVNRLMLMMMMMESPVGTTSELLSPTTSCESSCDR